jgi:DNA-binding NarL/FixJ family response regulator
MPLPIFLAEDDAQLRDSLIAAMDAVCDAEVVATAETEAEAVRWLNAHPRDWGLAVLDLFLRDGTGFGILQKLAGEAKDRVIVLTNSATRENRSRCLQLGARAVYDKTTELDQFLDHCLRHHRQQRPGPHTG